MRIDVKNGGMDVYSKQDTSVHSVEVGKAKTDGLIFICSGRSGVRTYLTKEEAVIIANALMLEARLIPSVDV